MSFGSDGRLRTEVGTAGLVPSPHAPAGTRCDAPEPANKTRRARLALGSLFVVGLLVVAGALVAGQNASNRCVPASAALIESISAGLTVPGSTLSSGYVVKSNDDTSVRFIAARINWPGVGSTGDGPIGVWASDVPWPVGTWLIFSVNGAAMGSSNWHVGDPGMSDDGASEALSCVK